jgi:glycosyltransferase involved in cell wall biosynthesis
MKMYGKIFGRFFLPDYLGIDDDGTPDTCTVSELIETFQHWKNLVEQLSRHYNKINLFTMFETSDVHPEIIEQMKFFDTVFVPFDYLKEVLEKRGLTNVRSINFFTSQLLREKPLVIHKKINFNKLIFLYIGTNDERKNVTTLTRVFSEVAQGTDHLLMVKTNKDDGLTQSKNVKLITGKINVRQMATLYNMCDYVISFTRGEGVGMPMVEGSYFGKPVIAHDQGVFRDIKKFINTQWFTLKSKEIPIDYTNVPPFLHKVFCGTWWEVDEEYAKKILEDIFNQ